MRKIYTFLFVCLIAMSCSDVNEEVLESGLYVDGELKSEIRMYKYALNSIYDERIVHVLECFDKNCTFDSGNAIVWFCMSQNRGGNSVVWNKSHFTEAGLSGYVLGEEGETRYERGEGFSVNTFSYKIMYNGNMDLKFKAIITDPGGHTIMIVFNGECEWAPMG